MTAWYSAEALYSPSGDIRASQAAAARGSVGAAGVDTDGAGSAAPGADGDIDGDGGPGCDAELVVGTGVPDAVAPPVVGVEPAQALRNIARTTAATGTISFWCMVSSPSCEQAGGESWFDGLR
ncbi:hypothetical protein GCM10011374_10750 [Kocuria dechangensis]|uniref:Uncharacterized protein n=1 Tax=Kocuria dechangensis TaxID=1176249 RepID=A0A917GLC5_9MICC|nr:hypothetical protein GCM10011374_10750 [Kocuria dechangensis]